MIVTDIIFLTTSSIGGAQVFVDGLSKYLVDENRTPLICFGKRTDHVSLFNSSSSIDTILIPSLSNKANILLDFESIFSILSILRKYPSANVITNSGKVSYLVRISCLLLRRRCFFIVHGWSYVGFLMYPKRFIYLLFESILELIDWSFCFKIFVSNYDRKARPLSFLNALPKQGYVIHNGITDPLNKLNNTKPNLARFFTQNKVTALKLLTVSRLSDQKDIESLIKSLLFVENVNLTIVGDGPNRNSLEELTFELGLNNRVEFLGSLNSSDTFTQYQICDLFTLVSNWEGFPLTTLEALSFSKPVILSDVGGAGEVFHVEPSLSFGQLIPKGNSPILISKLIAKYFDINLLAEHSMNSRKAYEKHFMSTKCFERYLKFFDSAIKI